MPRTTRTKKTSTASASACSDFVRSSDMIWFRPTQAFFDYFAAVPWRYKQFHDCGAGAGFLTQEMRKRKFDVKAYDMFPRERPLVPVIECNTGDPEDYRIEFNPSDCAIIARPCHHPAFIDATLERATEVGDAFYVGKAENIVPDLADFLFEPVARDVGEAGEVLVRVFGQRDKLHEHRLINSPSSIPRAEWWWYCTERARYTSSPGGLSGFDASGREKILDTKFFGNDLQVSVPKSEGCPEDSDMGWVAPDGEWFGAKFAQHDWVMENVIGIQVRRAEGLGFIRCQGRSPGSHLMLWSGNVHRKPSARQVATLKAKGYDPKY